MTEGSENKKGEKTKGFAGLSSLVSDVDVVVTPSKKQAPETTTGSATSQTPPSHTPVQSTPRSRPAQTHYAPSRSSAGSSSKKWFWGIGAVIGVIWFANAFNQRPTSSGSVYRPPAQQTSPTYSSQLSEPARPQEDLPPVGQSLVLTTAQITYCLAEDIRLEGANSAVDNYSDAQVNRYNAFVNDYNSRCGSFRYRSGSLESARRTVEPYRNQLLAEGRGRF